MNTKKILADYDKKYIWHPFTQMEDWCKNDPLIIDRGEGNYLIDIDGNKYLDGVSSLWVNVHGHNHPAINEAITEQLHKISHTTFLGLTHPLAIELAKKLVEITPEKLSRVFYSDNGSTAVEAGLKIVYQYMQQSGNKKKNKFISFVNAYHGDTVGSVSVGGIDIFHKSYGSLLFETYKVPYPYCYRCPLGLKYPDCKIECLNYLETCLEEKGDEIAGVVIEPRVQGAAGMLMAPEGHLKRVEDLCRKYEVFLIVDEVATGFGRTGKMFACELEGVQPDVMSVAKGITGGYLPLAATITSEEIYEGFLGDSSKTFFHGHSYTANPLGCAAALASLDLFEKTNLVEKIQTRIKLLEKELNEKILLLPNVGDIRQTGYMVGIELVKNKKIKEPFEGNARMGHRVIMEARKHGVIIRPLGDVIVLMPPLSITECEIFTLVSVVKDCIIKIFDKT